MAGLVALDRLSWTKDCDAGVCAHGDCAATFNILRRKHHCRVCGRIFCADHTQSRAILGGGKTPVRVCDGCMSGEPAAKRGKRKRRRMGKAGKAGKARKAKPKKNRDGTWPDAPPAYDW